MTVTEEPNALNALATAHEPTVRRNWFRALVTMDSIANLGVDHLDALYRSEAEKNGNPIPADSTRTESYGGFEVPEGENPSNYVQWAWDWWIIEFQGNLIPTTRNDLTSEQ